MCDHSVYVSMEWQIEMELLLHTSTCKRSKERRFVLAKRYTECGAVNRGKSHVVFHTGTLKRNINVLQNIMNMVKRVNEVVCSVTRTINY